MKILALRLKNLNSLVGEWQIDFTDPSYAADGIFAITGPTGAGKSTILDAICLALYGRTPRLDRVTKSTNEIMSRQTGECFAELVFETAGGRYRCHFSHHRARKRPDGELQVPKHEIANADSGEILESSLRGVAEQIEKLSGMNFDRFTRSMLLAQGGFAAFLQAAADERSPILEQITGTGIYSTISMRVHERHRDERSKLEVLQARGSGIVLLSADEEAATVQQAEQKQGELAALQQQFDQVAKALAWQERVAGLRQELAALALEAEQLHQETTQFLPRRQRLARAGVAAGLDAQYASLQALRQQQASDGTELQRHQLARPQLEQTLHTATAQWQQSRQRREQLEGEIKLALPLWRRVRDIDQQLASQQQRIGEERRRVHASAQKIAQGQRDLDVRRQQKKQVAQALQKAEHYLLEHRADEWLVGGLAGVEAQLQDISALVKESRSKAAEATVLGSQLKQAWAAEDVAQAQQAEASRAVVQAEAELQQRTEKRDALLAGRLLREYRSDRDALLREMVLLNQIAQLEDQRAQLHDGAPCPLCGSTSHPYTAGSTPQLSAAQAQLVEMDRRIQVIEAAEERCRTQGLLVAKTHEAVQQARQHADNTRNARLLAQSTADFAGQQLDALNTRLSERQHSVLERLQPLGIAQADPEQADTLLKGLRKRLEAWQLATTAKTDADHQLAAYAAAEQGLLATIKTQQAALDEQERALAALQAAFTRLQTERCVLFGNMQPDEEEQHSRQALAEAGAHEEQTNTVRAESAQRLQVAQAAQAAVQVRLQEREPLLKRTGDDFARRLLEAGFADEPDYLAACLPATERQVLADEAEHLRTRQAAIDARQKDRQARLAAEEKNRLSDDAAEVLHSQRQQLEETIETTRADLAKLRYVLDENQAARQRLAGTQTAIEAQKKECALWDSLHELIGSSDGKKYRNFAQGLTFDIVVAHANRQLQKMSDRYLLVRDATQPLVLNVLDSYQAGEVRSTRNLSGGESFIVSLSLALGLSQMASQRVRVDSLFLDEGFGTLDDEALDIALDTLAGLRQEGKLIGVISHVPALKERISTQIKVKPAGGGRSRLLGPGCSQPAGG